MAGKGRDTTTDPAVFPYDEQRGSRVWKIVEIAINDLVESKDLVETTQRDYIVGYICKKLERALPGR
jgi:hypothetical protein